MEQIPGESAAVMFAKKDKRLFANHAYKMYANQYIPLWKNVDIHERIRMQGMFDSMCSGGAIAHLNVTDSIEPEQMKLIIEHAAKQGVIYFAINMNMAKCSSCGKIYIGKFDKSPCHNAAIINYLRVVGFITPVEFWMPERREEYKTRQFYNKSDVKI
jgi:ribonucleoside-triphosphate reductase